MKDTKKENETPEEEADQSGQGAPENRADEEVGGDSGADNAAEESANSEESQGEDELSEVDRLKETLVRERADFINFRRRSLQEKEEATKRATERILNNLVPVLDAFDQLFSAASGQDGKEGEEASVSGFLEGAELIQKQMWQIFSDLGVNQIDPIDQEFNPSQMEALSVSESPDVDYEKVGQVYQKGYELAGRVIRPARVAVIKPAAPASAKEEENTEQ